MYKVKFVQYENGIKQSNLPRSVPQPLMSERIFCPDFFAGTRERLPAGRQEWLRNDVWRQNAVPNK